jgi:hypothetical protein
MISAEPISPLKTRLLKKARFEYFLVLLVWGCVAWLSVLFLHRLLLVVAVPPMPALGQLANPASVQQVVVSPLQKVFGGFDREPLALRSTDIQLVGFIHAGQDSVVAVRIRNEPTRYLRLLQADIDGWRLESVKDGEIEISRLGETYRLASYPSRGGLRLSND